MMENHRLGQSFNEGLNYYRNYNRCMHISNSKHDIQKIHVRGISDAEGSLNGGISSVYFTIFSCEFRTLFKTSLIQDQF